MNVADTRAEMMACVEALRARLAALRSQAARGEIVAAARREIGRLRKQFKRRIDQQAARRFGFAIHGREGIERGLAEATAAALALVEEAAASRV
jgi:hypothetical protein